MPADHNLPHVAPDPPRGALRPFTRLMGTAPVSAFERSLPWRLIAWRLVPRLMRLTGRLTMSWPFPTGLIETRDQRNGRPHRRAAIYFHDGDRVIVIPTKGGMPSDPFWFQNAVADPEVRFGGQPFRAEAVGEEGELARLWELADRFYPPYAGFREHAARDGRTIPILRLVPA
jgi:deazaflavin-dependent oxidoreductase (nitroreductase family)